MADFETFRALKSVLSSPRISRLIKELDSKAQSDNSNVEPPPPSSSPPVPSPPIPPQSLKLYGDVIATCRKCSDHGAEEHARAFVQAPPLSVVLCSNRLSGEADIEEVLLHELIHLYDLSVKKLDFTSCNQLAYSEVRANRESECKIGKFNYLSNFCRGSRDRIANSAASSPETPPTATSSAAAASSSTYVSSLSAKFSNGYNNWCTDRLKDCTRQAAYYATSNMYPLESRDCVSEVFEKAFKDMEPWGGRENATTSNTSETRT